MRYLNRKAITSWTLLGSMAILGACAKKGPAKWSDDERDSIFTKEEVSSAAMDVIMGEREFKAYPEAASPLTMAAQHREVPVQAADGSERLKPIFRNMSLDSEPGEHIQIRFALNAKYLKAYRLVGQVEQSFTSQSYSVAEASPSGDGYYVPLFQIPVVEYGIPIRRKNDLEEDTRSLRMEPSSWQEATHVRLSLESASIEKVRADIDTAKTIFHRQQLDQRVLTGLELKDLNLQIDRKDGLFYLQLNGSKLQVFEILSATQILARGISSEKLKDILAGTVPGFSHCADSVAKQAGLEADNCVLYQSYQDIEVATVKPRRNAIDVIGKDTIYSSAINFEEVAAGDSDFLQINVGTQVSETNMVELVNSLDPTRAFNLDWINGKEFLFRRTLMDSPNSFNYSFAGASGDLEIVKFNFKEDKIEVLKVDPIFNFDPTTPIDQEVLMVIPASYYKYVSTDDSGKPLSTPRLKKAYFSEPGAIAVVDWTQNQMPNTSSPLSYYGLEYCFDYARDREVTEVDQQLANKGLLNFSLLTTYAAGHAYDCAGIEFAGYFDRIQTNFTFKERISFEEYHKTDETPLMDLPYDTQKKFGFGLFTYSKKLPDDHNNTHLKGSEIPLPTIFNIRSGQKITYVLKGLPASGELRKAVIDSTRGVIADLNKAMLEALAGTPYERSDDPIQLLVAGEDVSETTSGQLGDLNYNYIYFMQKPTDFGIIGLGGNHSNPRSGHVESASVYLYGGNMMRMIKGMRDREAAVKFYDEVMGYGENNSFEEGFASNDFVGSEAFQQVLSGLPPEGAVNFRSGNLSKEHLRDVLRRSADDMLRVPGSAPVRPDALQQEIPDVADKVIKFYRAYHDYLQKSHDAINAGHMLEHPLQNPSELVRIFDINQSEAQRAHKGREKVIENMRRAGLCVLEDSPKILAGVNGGDLSQMSDVELFARIWGPTLAHEIGHNLGLRHNFEGSFDRGNWINPTWSNYEQKGNYSSVMDYTTDDHFTYEGLGPYDVAALRAAYGGVVQLDSNWKTQDNGYLANMASRGKIKVLDGGFISFDDIKTLVKEKFGVEHWVDLTRAQLAQLPFKDYRFCSDEETIMTPTCQRFDRGSTAREIVAAATQDYKAFYVLTNFRNDRLSYNNRQIGNYIGYLFSRFIPVRQFLEEMFFQLIYLNPTREEFNDYFYATWNGMQLFNEILRMPAPSGYYENLERFRKVSSGETSYPIESRLLEDRVIEAGEQDITIRGVEFDKVIATLMLTLRDIGFPRYENVGLRISYPDLERLLTDDGQSIPPLERPTIRVLHEMLSDMVQGISRRKDGKILSLDQTFKVDTNELTRVYSLLGSILFLDVDGLEADFNNSAHFRIMSGYNPPKDVTAVMRPGSSKDLYFWASPDAASGQALVRKVADLGAVAAVQDALTLQFQNWYTLQLQLKYKLGECKSDARGCEKDAAKIAKEIGKILNALPASVGMRDFKTISETLMNTIYLGLAVDGAQDRYDDRQYQVFIKPMVNKFEGLTRTYPALGAALESMDGIVVAKALGQTVGEEDEGIKGVNDIRPNRELYVYRGLLFRNIELLNQIYYMLHSEVRP